MHRTAFSILAGLVLAHAGATLAADEVNVTKGLTAAGAPLALHGYDPVAYFTVGAPTEGRAEYATVHDGASYYFANRQHLETFTADPDKYAPAFGGFCAYGVTVSKKFDGDPRFWTVSGGRLYLNLNAEIAGKFLADVPGNVAKANANWRSIGHAPVADL